MLAQTRNASAAPTADRLAEMAGSAPAFAARQRRVDRPRIGAVGMEDGDEAGRAAIGAAVGQGQAAIGVDVGADRRGRSRAAWPARQAAGIAS
ncbi:MAG: hypothetical protein WDM85_02990 [Caulobacteraceae bacterium]